LEGFFQVGFIKVKSKTKFMIANKVLMIRMTTDLYEKVRFDAKRAGYLQIAPYIRSLIIKNGK